MDAPVSIHSEGPVSQYILEVQGRTQITWGPASYLARGSWQATFLDVSSSEEMRQKGLSLEGAGSGT